MPASSSAESASLDGAAPSCWIAIRSGEQGRERSDEGSKLADIALGVPKKERARDHHVWLTLFSLYDTRLE